MELFKLLLIINIYYLFSYFDFYTKTMLFFGLSIFSSFIFNIFKTKNNGNKYQRLTYKYLVNTKNIICSSFIYLSETYIGNYIYLYLKILNDSYVEGRTFIFYNLINLMSSKKEINKKVNKNKNKVNMKENVFENDKDMMSFLDKIDNSEDKKNI
tara:strand:+ start:99 stop:563 length:465 start_codon:yes stop_codon:yes gene_type:complete